MFFVLIHFFSQREYINKERVRYNYAEELQHNSGFYQGWSQSSSIHPPDLAGSLEIERLRAEHKVARLLY